MGLEGVAKRWRVTQRPAGMTVIVVVAALVLLTASASLASASHHHICPTDMRSVKLKTYETAYFTSSTHSVRLNVEALGCVNDTRVLHLAELKVSNQTSQVMKLRWYEFSFINCGNYVVKIGSKIVKLEHFSKQCIHKPLTVSMEPPALLRRKCSEPRRWKEEVEKGKAACRELAGGAYKHPLHDIMANPSEDSLLKLFGLLDKQKKIDASDSFFDLGLRNDNKDNSKSLFDNSDLFFGKEEEPEKSKEYINDKLGKSPLFDYEDFMPPTPPSNFNEDNFSKRRNYKENAIPIFIGIVAFTVSMCLRFCLCRGKSVVRRVTTVTVIRGRPSSSSEAALDQQDPPPAYVDVVNENTFPDSPTDNDCAEPPPPAYADIANEVLPPTYSEVEAQSMPFSETASFADQETATQTSSPPPDPGSDPDDKGSGDSRGVLSKYRSRQKQFAFKVLEEDE